MGGSNVGRDAFARGPRRCIRPIRSTVAPDPLARPRLIRRRAARDPLVRSRAIRWRALLVRSP
jgi:hypothetical protein